MRGRDISEPAALDPLQRRTIEAFCIDRNALDPGPCNCEGITGSPIPRVFHSHTIAGVEQQLCTKGNRLLCATGDHNLFSRAGKAA
ncbi:hypothetical protein D3C75_1215550 [compost metagenome]